MIISYVDGNAEAASKADSLTPKEKMVLKLIAEGNGDKDIAAKLNLSVKTIDTHRTSFMKKLQICIMSAKLRASPCRTGLWGTALTKRLRRADARPAAAPFGGLSAPARSSGTPRPHGPCIPDGLLVRRPCCFLPCTRLRPPPLRKTTASLWRSERSPPGFNPAVASGSLTSQIGAQLFAGLVRTGKDGPIPYLAES